MTEQSGGSAVVLERYIRAKILLDQARDNAYNANLAIQEISTNRQAKRLLNNISSEIDEFINIVEAKLGKVRKEFDKECAEFTLSVDLA